MSEKGLNRQVLETIAKDIFKMEKPEQIEAFVCMFVYIALLD